MKWFWMMLFLGFAAMTWGWTGVGVSLNEWIGRIHDPTERGLAYVAVAIVLQALFSDARKVEVQIVRRGTGTDEVVAK